MGRCDVRVWVFFPGTAFLFLIVVCGCDDDDTPSSLSRADAVVLGWVGTSPAKIRSVGIGGWGDGETSGVCVSTV